MRTHVVAAIVVGLGLAGCPDHGLDPMRFCAEALARPAAGTCSVAYTACANAGTCSWRADCTVSGGTTSCHCVATEDPAGCHIDRSFTTQADLCGAVEAGDRAAVREAVFRPCLGVPPSDVDFSGI